MENLPETPVTNPFEKALQGLINKHSMETESDTPDFILAQYMFSCLLAYQRAVMARDKYFSVDMWADDKIAKPI